MAGRLPDPARYDRPDFDPPRTRRRTIARGSARQAILDSFTDLVADHGYDEASISAVAEAVGVSKGTVVHHFGTKDRILQESHKLYIERRLTEINRIMQVVREPDRQLCAMVYCILRAHRDDRSGTVAFLREFTRFASSDLIAPSRGLREEFVGVMSGILRRGLLERTLVVEDIQLTTLQIFGMCNYAWTWYRPDGERSPEEIASIFCRNMLLGLRVSRTAADGTTTLTPDEKWFGTLTPMLNPPYPLVVEPVSV